MVTPASRATRSAGVTARFPAVPFWMLSHSHRWHDQTGNFRLTAALSLNGMYAATSTPGIQVAG